MNFIRPVCLDEEGESKGKEFISSQLCKANKSAFTLSQIRILKLKTVNFSFNFIQPALDPTTIQTNFFQTTYDDVNLLEADDTHPHNP